MQTRASATDQALVQAHDQLRTESSFQFDRVGFIPPKAPGWLHWIGDLLQAVAPILKWVFWGGLVLLVGLVLFAIGREILRIRRPRPKAEKPKPLGETKWRPETQAARDLLIEADALAAEGLYAEASHLLLLRSVQDIERHQPRALRVSLTTREIASLKALPEAARPAFAQIGRIVERSLFGGAPVQVDDFVACRQAYEAFALPEGWRA